MLGYLVIALVLNALPDRRMIPLAAMFVDADWRPVEGVPADAIEALQRLPRFEWVVPSELRHPMHIAIGKREAFAAVHADRAKDPNANRLFAFIREIPPPPAPPGNVGVATEPDPPHIGTLTYESAADPSPPASEQHGVPDETWRFHIGPRYLSWRGAVDKPAVTAFLSEVRALLDARGR